MIPLYYYHFALFLLFSSSLFLFSLSDSQFSDPFINPTSMPSKRNFSYLSNEETPTTTTTAAAAAAIMGNSNFAPNNHKKLRRLPHVFSKVLELPFDSDFDVAIEEQRDCFRFVADVVDIAEIINNGVRAHVVEVHPGITKVVIRRRDDNSPILRNMDELQLDLWRFRLPGSARPELATAVYARGQLVVTVPKNGWGEKNRRTGGDCNKSGEFKGNFGNLVLVH